MKNLLKPLSVQLHCEGVVEDVWWRLAHINLSGSATEQTPRRIPMKATTSTPPTCLPSLVVSRHWNGPSLYNTLTNLLAVLLISLRRSSAHKYLYFFKLFRESVLLPFSHLPFIPTCIVSLSWHLYWPEESFLVDIRYELLMWTYAAFIVRKRQVKDLQQKEKMVLRKNKKGRPKSHCVACCVVPRRNTTHRIWRHSYCHHCWHRVPHALLCTAARNRVTIVCVFRLDVVPLNAEPHGRVDIIGQVDEVLVRTG